MRTRSLLALLAAVLLLTSVAAGRSRGDGADSIDEDLDRLRTALLPTEPAELVRFLHLRMQREPSRERLSRLIEALHATTPAARQQACVELVAIGKPALPLLRAVVPADADERALVRGCQKAIEAEDGALTIAVVHVLAHHRRPETASALLSYLPHAENEHVLEAIQEALNSVGHAQTGAIDPAVVAGLGDSHPWRRAAAIVALAQGSVWQYRPQLRPLLLDPSPLVRFRAAGALTQAADPESVSTLISLLGDPADPELSEKVEGFLAELAGETAPGAKPGQKAARLKGRDAWARWWRNSEGPGLLEELKRRMPSSADRERVQALIARLGDNRFRVRQQATKELILLEERALPLLKQAVENPADLETRKRSEVCITLIEKAKDQFHARLPAQARLIALRKPPGSAEAILAYLPLLDEDGLSEDLQYVLNTLVLSSDRPPPVLLESLTSQSRVCRAAAAEALCAGGKKDAVEAVRKLLEDPEPAVRLRVAVALARAGDAAGVPEVISLVAELPAEQSAQAEDFLIQLASKDGPKDLPDSDGDRKGRSAAWASWWQAHKSEAALAARALERFVPTESAGLRGYTLLVQPQANTVAELGRDGRPRWSLTGLLQPRDALVLPGQRVLVVEQNRVTERDLRGKILWQKELPQPLSVQQLRNGNVFLTCPDQLIELSRTGKEVRTVRVSQGVKAARRLPDGRIVAFSFGNEVVQLDRAGREVKRTPVQCGGAGSNEVLDNGHVLALSPGNGNIIEFDMDGKTINRFDVQGAAHGFRLPNGHTLVTVRGRKYIELDRKWQPIKETSLPTPAFRVKRR
jgi:HEAT repeat protein